jgi:competence protein ComEC
MAAIGLMAVLSGRRRQAIPVLAAAVLALMLVSPSPATPPGWGMLACRYQLGWKRFST